MSNAIGTWIGIIGAAAGLIVLFAGLVVAARGSYNKARIQSLREDLEDSRRREEDRQKDIDRLKVDQQVDHAKIEGLIRENIVLKDLVTQRVEIAALQSMLESHHNEAVGFWTKVDQHLQALEIASVQRRVEGGDKRDKNQE